MGNIENSSVRLLLLSPSPPPFFSQWLRRPCALTPWEIERLAGGSESNEQEQLMKRKLSNYIAKTFYEAGHNLIEPTKKFYK